jgi:hypothetical protein
MSTRKFILNERDLAHDPEIAHWMFNNVSADDLADPLIILLQREAEEQEYENYEFYLSVVPA